MILIETRPSPNRTRTKMSDDDPFAVVAPSEKKMSSYLKKSKDPSSRKCVETSSHGTNSTRSTATSTLPSDEMNFSAPKSMEKSSKHKSSSSSKVNTNAFHNSNSSSGSANFDFGDGLEFGHAFPETSTSFGDDGFGMMDHGFDNTSSQRKAQSSRNFKSDPFLPYPSAPKSMKNLSSTKETFDAFGSDDPFHGMDDGFGSFGNSHNDDDDDDGGFMFHDDPFGNDAFAPSASVEENVAFRQEALKSGSSRENLRRVGSRENVRRGARSRSGERPKRSASEKRRGMNSRRNISSTELSVGSSEDRASPRAGARKAPSSSRRLELEGGSSSHHKRRDLSPRRGDEHSPVRRTRGGLRANRRSTMDHSGHTQNSDAKSQSSDHGQHRPLSSRRGSVSCAYSDGSLEPANVSRVPPVRNKSLTGPAHRPAAGRRQRRASVTHTSATDLGFMSHDVPSKEDHSLENEKDDGWNNERSRNQEKIMDMTRGGTLSNKSDHKSNDSSLDHIGKHLDMMVLATDESMPSSNDPGASRGRLRRGGKKEKNKEEEEEYKEPKDRKDRTKGSLLDRVAAGGDSSSSLNEIPSTSARGKSQSSGLSYSDRIMMAQQRSKPN